MPADRSQYVLIAMALQLGAAVAFPTGMLGWGGHLLDVRYGTGSLFLILGLALAFVLSMTLVWRIVRIAQKHLGS